MANVVDPVAALPPWEAARYFQAVKETVVALPFSGVVTLCNADPMRVVLVIGTSSGAALGLSTRANVASQQGIFIGNFLTNFTLSYEDHGPLVQMAWYGYAQNSGNVTVLEVALSNWPSRPPGRKVISHADVAPPIKRVSGSVKRRTSGAEHGPTRANH